MGERRRAILTAALAALGAAATPACAPAALVQSTPVVASGQVVVLRATLLGDDVAAGDRELAARRLVADGGDDAAAALADALAADRPAATQLAAATALADAADPPASLAAPLLARLTGETPAAVLREVGRALAGYGPASPAAEKLLGVAAADGPTPVRQAAVGGLGRVPTRRSAAALVGLLDGNAPQPLEADAAAALILMTGQRIADDDLAGWAAWWRGVSDLDETAFQAALLRGRAAAVAADRRRAADASAALYLVVGRQYRKLPRPEQTALLVESLQSPSAELRGVAARLALDDASFAEALAQPVAELMRRAIGDPDERVRTTAAQVARRRADEAARDPLLVQVVREPSAEARLAQVAALAELKDPGALGAMLALVNDPSAAVRLRAAGAAADLSADPTARRRTADALRNAFDAADAQTRAGRRERRDLLTALSRLNEPDLLNFYVAVLTRPPRPSGPVRAAALAGLTTLASDRVGDIVVEFLKDEDARVREQAVRATGATSLGFSRADTLLVLTQEGREPDAAVRRAAWETLVTLFPKASLRQLATWPGNLRDQPERRLTVLRVLVDKAKTAGEDDLAASWQQESGDVLLNDLARPADAAVAYRAALQYSLEHPTAAATIKARTESVLTALLRAGDFSAATAFAGEAIGRDRGSVEDVGRVMKLEAARYGEQGQTAAARSLIEAALKMAPPLDGRTAGQLSDLLKRLPPPPPAG